MITLKEMVTDLSNIDEAKLVELSDQLWNFGSLENIKENVSPELFYLHVSMNLVGNWKSGGWWYILCEQADFVPYIPAALEKLNLPALKTAFEHVIQIFPEFTVFRSDDNAYCDIVNFLQNTRFRVQDERLKCIAPEKRKELAAQIRQKLNILEDLTEPVWGECSECNGWKPILDFVSVNAAMPKKNLK